MKLGGGGRFQKLVKSIESKGKGVKSAQAIAASIGIKKYGQKKMTKMAVKGKLK